MDIDKILRSEEEVGGAGGGCQDVDGGWSRHEEVFLLFNYLGLSKSSRK